MAPWCLSHRNRSSRMNSRRSSESMAIAAIVAPCALRSTHMGELLAHVRAYSDALNGGAPDEVASCFTGDAVHYYARLGPHEGAKAIGEHTKLAVEHIEGQWVLEHGIDNGEEAVIEWTMTWRDPR